MAKLRLTQPGFETYTAQLGVMWFVDGLSTSDVSPNDARRMAAVMQCEWEGGGNPNNAQKLLDNQDTPAPVFSPDDLGTDNDREAAATNAADLGAALVEPNAVVPLTVAWTREQLEAVADKDGMGGLRAIADPLGLKATSIAALISSILSAPRREVK